MKEVLDNITDIKSWISNILADFNFDIVGFATSKGNIIPLNLEPGTLGNIIEGVLIAHISEKLEKAVNVKMVEGGNRYFPDIELTGELFKNKLIALDIKAARRSKVNANRTQSRITLYTFGTYLKFQDKKFPQTIRPFNEYDYQLDLLAIFDVDQENNTVGNFDLIIAEPWKIASKTASSATRDYVGAIMEIDKMKKEEGGAFASADEFYSYWGGIPRRGQKKL